MLDKIAQSLFYVDRWNIGLIEMPIDRFLESSAAHTVRWLLPDDPNAYFADPFALKVDHETWVLYEKYDFGQAKGLIEAVRIDDNGVSAPRPLFDFPVHLSYPYLFALDETVYLLPEMGAAQRIELFRATSFPDQWERVSVLVDQFAAVDGTLFQHNDMWWLFATDGNDDADAALHCWYAPALEGPWQPHRSNPIKHDRASARPAGTPFVHDGSLYRPAQDCSVRYGGSVVFNRIDLLTPERFEETVVATLSPFDVTYSKGLHTVSKLEQRVIIDGLRRQFIGFNPTLVRYKGRQLRKRLRAKLAK